jgi:dipeptidyl aminopeptidase/acylaminoacyl peptidase
MYLTFSYQFAIMRSILIVLLTMLSVCAFAQKKPLDHSVYDAWESIGERRLSDNGQWLAYAKTVQEGDAEMVIRATSGERQLVVPRGYNAQFTADNRYVVMMIRPIYADVREARIRKKKPEESPRDSLCIVDLATLATTRRPSVRAYVMPVDANGLLAVHLFPQDSSRRADADEGSDLVVGRLGDSTLRVFDRVSEFKWSRNGRILVMEGRQAKATKGSVNGVMVYRTREGKLDTIARGGNEFSHLAVDSNAYQVAFTAERDSGALAPQKFHKLWYWKNGMDSAVILADKNTQGMRLGWTVSEFSDVRFSDSGDRLFFGTAPIRAPRDTSVPEIDQVKLDIWHYKDDYLQTQQLYDLNRELRRNYLAMYDLNFSSILQVGNENIREVITTDGGDGPYFIGVCDTGRRVQSQWTGESMWDVYVINAWTGAAKLIRKNISSFPQASPGGKYVYWYDEEARAYFTFRDSVRNISRRVPQKLYDEDHDSPNTPPAYGIAKWTKDDAALLVYDRYDMWQLDPEGTRAPVQATGGQGRMTRTRFRYVAADAEAKYIDPDKDLLLRAQREDNKHMGLYTLSLSGRMPVKVMEGPYAIKNITMAKYSPVLAYTRESFAAPTDLYVRDGAVERKVSATNPQQSRYTWGTAELVEWKAYDGRMSQGILFRPDGFDPARKYPMICYFYERDSDSLFVYRPPSPVRSRIDISFFVSRGYVIFLPDIHYRTGYPGRSAYDYVVSGARAMVRKGGIDSTRIGIQGQSWGGYQAAHIITRTPLFAAAWAGAPVANMTSAYGGIRWESGVNRQFQYEKTQSRIGATLWEKRDLYIENSPLFHVPAIRTPLVIMSNDNDGAVPWYQGIEMFTAMRRLGKKVWLLNYNGEEHNLVQRKNKKDLSVREQQYFDWLLKGEKPPVWLTDGVPATEKGRTLGLN